MRHRGAIRLLDAGASPARHPNLQLLRWWLHGASRPTATAQTPPYGSQRYRDGLCSYLNPLIPSFVHSWPALIALTSKPELWKSTRSSDSPWSGNDTTYASLRQTPKLTPQSSKVSLKVPFISSLGHPTRWSCERQFSSKVRFSAMPIDSRFSVDIPRCSIQKWIFGSSSGSLSDSKAWIDPDDPTCYLSLSSARLLAKRIAVGLKDHGVQTGDRVLIFSGNSIYFPAIVLGIWMAGCVFTGASPAYTARELAFQLKDSKASVVLTTPENAQTALDAARSCGLSAEDIFLLQRKLDTEAEGFESIPKSTSPRDWTHLIASKARGHSFDWVEPQRPEDTVCTLNYSSGTTGLPKGVEITHYNIVANSIAVETVDELDTRVKPDPANCPSLCVLPMYHAYCQLFYLCNLPRAHTPVYVMSHFDFPKFLSHVTKYRITSVMAVPPILNLIAKHPLAAKADLSSLISLGSGAAPLAAQTQNAAIRKIGTGGMVRQGWGMSELTSTGMVWDASREISTAVGELIPGNQARLVDVLTGEEITEANKPGELWIASPTLMRGYWRNPEATAAAISRDEKGTRWFRTGDIFQVDNYGPGALFYLVDRAKELIKVKGFQVAPAELEALLLQRSDIADVAVTGVAHGQEEQPKAHVVRAPNTSTTAAEIEGWVAERVARYKRLTGGVVFVDSIPRNPAGKVLRKILRENAVKAHL